MYKECLLIMLGGGIGASLRYIVCTYLRTNFSLEHWATFWVNITGCFALGLLFDLLLQYGQLTHTFILGGIIGSYTTFSAFEYENIDLLAHERYFEFLKYSFFSCAFAFMAVAAGFYIGKCITPFFLTLHI